MDDFNQQIIDEFRANDGVVGGPFEGAPMVLVHHFGAKSGTERVTPLMYKPEGDAVVIFASAAGAPNNPAWYHNLVANPDTSIEVGREVRAVRATEVTGDERDRIFNEQKAAYPQFAEYEASTTRTIPIIRLDTVAV